MNYEGVSQWQVKGIQYAECEFNRLNQGIATINSSFLVNKSEFKTCSLAVMVNALAPSFAEQTIVGGALLSERNYFENCRYSVTSNGYNFLQVSFNSFKNCLFGVNVEGSSGFQVTDNIFQHTGSPALLFNAAISAVNSGPQFNFAECNQYLSGGQNKINVGISALGSNRNFTFRKEDFDCNRDVQVLKAISSTGMVTLGQISGSQGTPINAVRNLFTGVQPNGAGGFGWKFGHTSDIFTTLPNPPIGLPESIKFDYYYPPTAPIESRLVPKCPKAGFGLLPLCNQIYNFENKKPAGDGADQCDTRIIQDYYNGPPNDCRSVPCLGDYYSNIRRADSLLNMGTAALLLSAVQSSPNSTTTLQMLNAASPYLSDNILNTVALSATMTVTNKGTVLNANAPIAMDLLPTWVSYLPSTLYNQLLSTSNTTTLSSRTLLQSEKAVDERNKSALLGFLTDSLYKASNYAQVEALLLNDSERQSREALVGLKIQRQQYSAAQALLNSYPNSDPEDVAFRDVQNINLRRITQGLSFQLTAAEDTFLHQQAYAYGAQTGYARSMLYLIKGETFERTIPQPEVTANKQELQTNSFEPVRNHTKLFKLQPNPASEDLKIIYPGWREADVTRIQIIDLSGVILLSSSVRSSLTVLNITKLPSGFYLVSLFSNDRLVESQKLVKQ